MRDQCDYEATKVYGAQIAKWKDENQTDVFNPYRRESDQLVQNCITKDGKWCLSKFGPSDTSNSIWPGTFPLAFAPKDQLARWVFAKRYIPGGEYPECN